MISEWILSKGGLIPDHRHDKIAYSFPLLVDGNNDGIPYWDAFNQTNTIRLIQWGESGETGFAHGAITLGLVAEGRGGNLQRLPIVDMRSCIQSLSLGGFFFARISLTENVPELTYNVTGQLFASQPFVGGLDTIPAASNWINPLSELETLAVELDRHTPFYVKYEWQMSPEPETSQDRPTVRLLLYYGTDLESLTPLVIACTDFSVMPEFLPTRPPTGFGVTTFQKWSIGVDGLYVLGPSLREMTYIVQSTPKIFYYSHTATAIPAQAGAFTPSVDLRTENYVKVW